jgi:hypothetical protein
MKMMIVYNPLSHQIQDVVISFQKKKDEVINFYIDGENNAFIPELIGDEVYYLIQKSHLKNIFL